MIQTNELRINNYVQFDELSDLEGVHQVQTIAYTTDPDRRNIELFNNYVGNRQDQLFGIPLTPEILEKCGFKIRGKDDRWYHLKLGFTDYGIMLTFTVYGIDTYLVQFGSAGIQPNCEYLHQLQNLYFCLCGEELTIKL